MCVCGCGKYIGFLGIQSVRFPTDLFVEITDYILWFVLELFMLMLRVEIWGTHMHICIGSVCVYVNLCVFMCIRVSHSLCVCVYRHIYKHKDIHTHKYGCIYTYGMCMCMCVRVCACVFMFVYAYKEKYSVC